jgi:GWxTD domain-containing protein
VLDGAGAVPDIADRIAYCVQIPNLLINHRMADCYKRGWFWLPVVLIVLLLPAAHVQAQVAEEDFEVDVLGTRSEENPGMTRLDTYTRIPYRHLSFINSINGFTASYEVKLDASRVSDDGRIRNLVQSKIWDASVVANTYSLTQADDLYDYTTQSIELAPGRYIFEYSISDRNSSQTHYREYDVNVRDFSQPVAVSDITLLESFDEESFTIVPRIDGRISSESPGFQVFYEVYADRGRDLVIRQEVTRTLGDLVYAKEETATVKSGRTQYLVTVPIEDMKVGGYELRVVVENLSGTELARSTRPIKVEWSGLSEHIETNMDDAIAQMEYIAKKRDLSFIQSAPNDVERFQRFRSFWDKRDPTPGTSRNERMEEYYYRIAQANRNYGAVDDGWRTDRGFVLVRFGEPDFVQKKPHSFDYEPYEVWVYERIGRQFIFVDKTGFGDYQLLVPIWDERTKLY